MKIWVYNAAGQKSILYLAAMKKQNHFSDLKVVELGSVLAIPAVGMFFAELGAKVIKIENPKTGGDITRQWKLDSEDKHSEWSAYYASVNYGKEVIYLDFTKEDGMQQTLGFLYDADIVLCNFRPSSASKLKLDYDSLRKKFPNLIYGHITGYGDDRPAFDLLLQAETGFISMNGSSKDEPAKLPVAFIDLFAAHQLKEGLLTALLLRSRNNKGAYVHVSLYQAAISSLANQASNWLNAGHDPKPIGTLHPNIAPYGDILNLADGQKIILAVGSEKQFASLCIHLKLDHLLKNDKFSTNRARVKNRQELTQILNHAVQNLHSDEILKRLQKAAVPAAPISSVSQALTQYQNNHQILSWQFDEKTHMQILPTAIFEIDYPSAD